MRNLVYLLMLSLLLAACSRGGADVPDADAADQTQPTATSAATATSRSDPPTATRAVDTPTPTPAPAPTSAADEYARQGYAHFDRSEIALMVHPRLSEEPTDPPTAEAVLYSFVDLNSSYLCLDIDILKTSGSRSEVSDGFIREHIAGLVESAPHISGYEVFDSQETALISQPGRIARFHFTSDGQPAYGVLLLVTYDDWLYRFIIYGDAGEYSTLEDIVHSIYQTAFLRGPG